MSHRLDIHHITAIFELNRVRIIASERELNMMECIPCRQMLRLAAVAKTLLVVVICAKAATAAESNVQVQLNLEKSQTVMNQPQTPYTAQLTLRGYDLRHLEAATVNGTQIPFRRDQEDTNVQLRFEGTLPSVCRIQAGDASLKFLANPGQFYVCSVATKMAPTEPVPSIVLGPTTPVPPVPFAVPAAVSPATIDPKVIQYMAELASNLEEVSRLNAEAYALQNELNQADGRKHEFEAYQIEIAELEKKRDAVIVIRNNFWVLQKKTGGIIDIPDATGGIVLSELQLAIAGIEARKREVEKLGPLINADNARAKDIHFRLEQISAGRMSLGLRRIELKKAIP